MNLVFTSLFLIFMGIYLGPSFAIAQTLAPIHMRAMSTALFFFILNMIGLGLGPSISGWMIDIFKANNGEVESIRYAMTVTSLVFIPSIISFLVVARKLPEDWATAEKNNLKLAKSEVFMIESFLQYGQWVILVLSILSLVLVSSVKHETRLNGYILTGISRFAGALFFWFLYL
jgi:MFS family permease